MLQAFPTSVQHWVGYVMSALSSWTCLTGLQVKLKESDSGQVELRSLARHPGGRIIMQQSISHCKGGGAEPLRR